MGGALRDIGGQFMKVLICWSNISGYMAACWRELARRQEVDLKVVSFSPQASLTAPFDPGVVAGVDVIMEDSSSDALDLRLQQIEASFRPDVAVVSGWIHPAYVQLATRRRKTGAPTVMTLDQPWLGSPKQRVQQVCRRGYVAGMDLVVTASVWATAYAERLGADRANIRPHLYGFDHAAFAAIGGERVTAGTMSGRGFLFVGRFVKQKGLDVLLEAYLRYRGVAADPWDLIICGTGPMEGLLRGVEGVDRRGFIQPTDLPAVFREAGAFVLPSRYEPWGVVVAEAAASGLPLVLSDRVGAGLDLLRHHHNGFAFPSGSAAALAEALALVQGAPKETGIRGIALSEAFGAQAWADRWVAYLKEAARR